MSDAGNLALENHRTRPTSVRHALLSVLTLMSVLLYLDRFAVGIAAEYIRQDLRMSQAQMSWFISAFFWSYALCQVPAGWLSDRFGGRIMLTLYIVAWSVFTGLMGIAHDVWLVLWLRLFCGAAQAGAYPTAVSLLRQWYPISNRGTASSIVGLGGRFGAVLAPLLTAWLIIDFVSVESRSQIQQTEILDEQAFLAMFDTQKDVGTPRQQFVTQLLSQLTPSQRDAISAAARNAVMSLENRSKVAAATSQQFFDLRDWLPIRSTKESNIDRRPIGFTETVEILATRMSAVDFVDFEAIPLRLSADGQQLLDQRNRGTRLTESETLRLNRRALEALFPKEIAKVEGPGWRPTVILYGVSGLLVAFAFAFVTRNTPASHRWCNDEERNFIDDEATKAARQNEPGNPQFPWKAFLGSASLWGNSLCQFLTNVGWLFVVTWLPRYLDDVHGVSLVTKGIMTAFPSGIGILGLFLGGRATDLAVRRFGLKRGRQIPLAASRFTAAGGYAMCLILSYLFTPSPEHWWLPWLYIVGLCIGSMSTDFGSPAIWAYAQDVGGRYSASILGWGNMWGNLGAAVAPLVYHSLLGEKPTLGDWNMVFGVCCGVFVVAGFCAMLVDSTKPLTVERS